MKFIVSAFFLALTTCLGIAQTTKIYKTTTNAFTDDSTIAKSYVLINKLDDTSYMTSEYNMLNELMERGMYKDKSLQIPNGKFYYYTVYVVTPGDSVNPRIAEPYLRKSGYFTNGARNGTWLLYRYDGKKYVVDHYVNDKLNGLHQMIGEDGTTTIEEGMYVNGKKEKEWNYHRIGFEKPTMTQIYSHDKLVNETIRYKPFVIDDEFYRSLKKSLKQYIDILKYQEIKLTFLVSETGKIDSIKLETQVDPIIHDEIINAFSNVPHLRPSTFDGKPLSEKGDFNLEDIGLHDLGGGMQDQSKLDDYFKHVAAARGVNPVTKKKPVN
jgi:antitoxin component YwqK of YwqJK toxin-antitoxin module